MDAKLDIHRVPGTTNQFGIVAEYCANREIEDIIWCCEGCSIDQHGHMGSEARLTQGFEKHSGRFYILYAYTIFKDGGKITSNLKIFPKDIPKPSLISRLLTNWI